MLGDAFTSANDKWMRGLYGALGVLFALFVFVLGVYLFHLPLSLLRQRNEARKETIQFQPSVPVIVQQTQNLVNETITVSARNYYNVSFTIDASRMQNAVVLGSFKASGGSGNDIIALVMDDMAYINWRNEQRVNFLYNSEQRTTGDINVSIATSGQYHLIYSNRFSFFSSKNVDTNVDVKWLELQYH